MPKVKMTKQQFLDADAKLGQIQLRCPECNATAMAKRFPDDPPRAMEKVIICLECDDGDFHSPTYLTASGREVDWETGKAI